MGNIQDDPLAVKQRRHLAPFLGQPFFLGGNRAAAVCIFIIPGQRRKPNAKLLDLAGEASHHGQVFHREKYSRFSLCMCFLHIRGVLAPLYICRLLKQQAECTLVHIPKCFFWFFPNICARSVFPERKDLCVMIREATHSVQIHAARIFL
jgi:hypothetical protein